VEQASELLTHYVDLCARPHLLIFIFIFSSKHLAKLPYCEWFLSHSIGIMDTCAGTVRHDYITIYHRGGQPLSIKGRYLPM
jgi:hypothetical protein